MPSVPYRPFPTAEPQVEPTGKIGVSVPGAAFGENVAQATERLGGTIEKGAGELGQTVLSRQGLINEAYARDADADAMIKMGDLHAKYSATEGKEAVEGYDAYVASLKDVYKSVRESIPNPAAQRMYDATAQSTMSRTIFNGAGHAAAQQKSWLDQGIDSEIKGESAKVVLDSSDNTFHQSAGRIEGLMKRKGELKGWSDKTTQEATREMIQNLVQGRLVSIARVNPLGARAAFTANKEVLDEKASDTIENAISISEAKHGAKLIADDLTKDLTAEDSLGHLGLLMEEGDKKAREISPTNTDMSWNVRSLIRSKYDQLQVAATADTRKQEAIVGDWIHQNNITDLNQINTEPTVFEAYTHLNNTQRRALDNQINYNARRDANLPSKARDANFERLSGMPGGGQVHEFNNINLDTQDLTKDQRAALLKTQNKTRKGEAVDPHVTRVLNDPNVKAMLFSSDVITGEGKPADIEQYNRLSGMIKASIENFFDQRGKWPTPEEEHAMAAKALRSTAQYEGNWGWRYVLDPTSKRQGLIYKEGIPDKVREKIVNNLKASGEEEPTEEQVMKKVMELQEAVKASK